MWDILDFSQHDPTLRWNLTDDDLGALLAVIDGRNKLKKLFLTETGPGPWKNGLSRITGYGLEPLRGSDMMVQIDIDCPYISEDVALPIIESFIESRQSSLRHISLPEHWRKNKSSNLVSFLRRYDDFLYRLRFGCQQCGARVGRSRHNDHRIECINIRHGCGEQIITCYICLGQFCTRCKSYDGEPVDPSFCNSCERYYCYGCASIDTCGGCGDQICEHCRGLDEECQGWECENPYFCVGCCEDDEHIFKCSYCESHMCKKCSGSTKCEGWDCFKVCCDDCYCEFDTTPRECRECKYTSCKECRWAEYKASGYVECEGCRGLLFSSLEEENVRLRKEMEEMKVKLASMQEK